MAKFRTTPKKLERLLGVDGFRFLKHALDAPERLLPHTEVAPWGLSWVSSGKSNATWQDRKRRGIALKLFIDLAGCDSESGCMLVSSLRRKKAPKGIGNIHRTLDDRERDVSQRIIQRAAGILRGAKPTSTGESLRAILVAFDEQVVAAHLKEHHRLNLEVADTLSAMRQLSEQSYENKSISFGCLLDPNRTEAMRPESAFPIAFLGPKKYRALTDGFRTAYRVSSGGHVVGFEDCATRSVRRKGRHYFPEWCEYVADASHHDECGLCLTRHGDILSFDAGTLRFTYRFGRWQYWNHSHIIDLMFQRARVQKVPKEKVGKVMNTIYRSALDVSFRRSGGLFVVLRNRKNLSCIVAPGDEIDNAGRSPLDRTFDDAIGSRKIQNIPRRVLAELAALDGAIVVSNTGDLLAYGAVLRPRRKGKTQSAEGSRTKAAIGASNYGLSVKVSSDGGITFFEKGKVFLET